MTKFLYSHDVIRVDTKNPIAIGFQDKAQAERLAVIAINNVPGREFKVRTRRIPNPAYTG